MVQSQSKNPLVRQLFLCGQIAEHKSERMTENGRDLNAIFSALTEEEQEQLAALLSKLQAQWRKEHAEYHKRAQAQSKDN